MRAGTSSPPTGRSTSGQGPRIPRPARRRPVRGPDDLCCPRCVAVGLLGPVLIWKGDNHETPRTSAHPHACPSCRGRDRFSCWSESCDGEAPDLPVSFVICPLGKSTPLQPGVTYQASTFPIALRLTPPDWSWSGGQWKTGSSGSSVGRPLHRLPPVLRLGLLRAGLRHKPPTRLSRDLDLVRADTLRRHRSEPSPKWAAAERGHVRPTTHHRARRLPGVRLDGEVVGRRHVFLRSSPSARPPDSPTPSHSGRGSSSASSSCT